jgi:hypothetical protein
MFASASEQTKYAVASSGAGKRSIQDLQVDRDSGSLDEIRKRHGQSVFRENAGVNSAREFAELGLRTLQLRARRAEHRSGWTICACNLQRAANALKPLLRAFAKLSFESPALRVSCLDDSASGRFDVLNLPADLRLEANVRNGDACRGGDRIDKFPVLKNAEVVHQGCKRIAILPNEGDLASGTSPRQFDWPSRVVDVRACLGYPVADRDGGVAERGTEPLAE